MKLLVSGSHTIEGFKIDAFVTEETELIISGGSNGVDAEAELCADDRGISKLILRPNYKKHGKDAIVLRNQKMMDLCDKAVIIWDGNSCGTKQLLDYASTTEKDVTLVIVSSVKKKNDEL